MKLQCKWFVAGQPGMVQKQNKTQQNKTKQNKKTQQNKATQNKTKQSNAKQNKTKQPTGNLIGKVKMFHVAWSTKRNRKNGETQIWNKALNPLIGPFDVLCQWHLGLHIEGIFPATI
jgi:hypothetical protein